MLLLFWRGPVVPVEIFSGGNSRIGGGQLIDALGRIGLGGADKDGGAIGAGVHDQAARIGSSPDVGTLGRVGSGTLKAKPGRIG
jgi:hypothetical protein